MASLKQQEMDISGLKLRWVINVPQQQTYFPFKRSMYFIGLKYMYVSNIKNHSSICHLCISPDVNVSTYLPNGNSIMAVKSIFIGEHGLNVDFSDHMEYFKIDMERNYVFGVCFKNNKGEAIEVQGNVIFDMIEI